MHKCYLADGDTDEGRCPNFAQYVARLDWTEGRIFVCAYHARELRIRKEVISLETMKVDEDYE